ncbi:chromate transporter [Bacteroides caecigallinarum]|uniref:chromate transporter n=1 Tax=Bacteroides caecigallinarum TaxID=1411144 RepID=UPI00195991AC|nr:chromate transporter [Bacteroides caecigallinarum]MBM6883545.1 chromate transporter [Bacteroides caecigallinarum]
MLYLKYFAIFFRIGLFTIGGGYAMVPLIEAEIVDKLKWIKKEEFLDLMALAQTVPGIFAVNIAIFIGYKLKKFMGAFFMTLGTIMPSFLIILAIALFFRQFQHLEPVERIFKGIRPGVVALIAAPTFKMAKTARINRYNVWIPVVSALLIWLLGFSPVYVIILSGLGGYIYGRYKKKIN